ncbi:MAG: hypothetical protein SW833_19710 [Cyanobacteriota bacterium]|nr:hypothetical protein [Cyanobacteriota bacterium]
MHGRIESSDVIVELIDARSQQLSGLHANRTATVSAQATVGYIISAPLAH